MAHSHSDRRQTIQVATAEELRSWLENHHTQQDSVWLVSFKKHVADSYLSTEEVLDEIVCYGWIDGARRKLDTDRTMQLISPRRTRYWAKTYKERAARLIAEGRMQPAGYSSIETAKADGLWNFMDDVDALLQPEDLNEALARHQSAADRFAAFPPSYRRNVLRWIKLAKTSRTRLSRVTQVAELAASNQRVPHL